MGYYCKTNKKKKILGHIVKNQTTIQHTKNVSQCNAKKISEVFSYTTLKNKQCFLFAGGPSLKNFNYKLVEDKFTIGMNKSFMSFSPSINYSMDMRFYNLVAHQGNKLNQQNLYDAWNKYTGYKVFLCPRRKNNPPFADDIYVVDRIIEKSICLDVSQGIYPASNSGLGALMLAIAIGAREIYLLGYDMQIFNCKQTHWHEGYDRQEPDAFLKNLEKFMLHFEEFANDMANLGIKVINLNPDSALDCFPKSTISEVLSG